MTWPTIQPFVFLLLIAAFWFLLFRRYRDEPTIPVVVLILLAGGHAAWLALDGQLSAAIAQATVLGLALLAGYLAHRQRKG